MLNQYLTEEPVLEIAHSDKESEDTERSKNQ